MSDDKTLEAEVRGILDALPHVVVRKDGLGWLVGCGFNGIEQAGHTSISDQTSKDPRDLARRLLLRAYPPAPEPVAEPEPTPDPAPSGVFDSGPTLEEVRDAYEDSHTDNEGAGDVGLAEHSGADLGGDGGEHGEAGPDVDSGEPADFSAEPVGDDLELGDEHQAEDVSPANLGGVLIQGDALATAKAMALMTVDDERFARVGDYDKAANEFRLNKLRSAQQAIKQGVEPAIDPPYSAEEHQALETFMPLMQRIDDHAQGLRNAIREAADLEQLTAIDLLHGWPD